MEPDVPRNRDCSICFNNIENNITSTKLNWKKVLKKCKTHLDTSIIIKSLKNKTQLLCCNYCYESACQLTTLQEQVKKLEKEISDFSLLFSKTVLERRSLVEKRKGRNSKKLAPRIEKCITLQKTPDNRHSVAVREKVIVKEEVNESVSNELPSDSEMNTENDDLGTTDSWFEMDDHENDIDSNEETDVKYSFDETFPNVVGNAIVPNQKKLKSTTNAHDDQKPKTSVADLIKQCVKMPIIKLERLLPEGSRNSPKIAAGTGEETMKLENDKDKKLDLQNDNKLNNTKRPYACSLCDLSFLKPSMLKMHQRNHKGQRPYKCTLCPSSFKGAKHLKVHERKIHSGEKLHKCSICSKSFDRSTNLKEHKAIHFGERPYKCSFCEKSFKRANTLKEHETVHSGNRPHKCSFCTKVFLKPSMLKVHERVHTGERPFICSFCARSFISASLLNKHEKCHSEEKPYSCSFCSRSFRRSSHLKTHQKTHSSAETVHMPDMPQLPNLQEEVTFNPLVMQT